MGLGCREPSQHERLRGQTLSPGLIARSVSLPRPPGELHARTAKDNPLSVIARVNLALQANLLRSHVLIMLHELLKLRPVLFVGIIDWVDTAHWQQQEAEKRKEGGNTPASTRLHLVSPE
jgi:hypothetical protein